MNEDFQIDIGVDLSTAKKELQKFKQTLQKQYSQSLKLTYNLSEATKQNTNFAKSAKVAASQLGNIKASLGDLDRIGSIKSLDKAKELLKDTAIAVTKFDSALKGPQKSWKTFEKNAKDGVAQMVKIEAALKRLRALDGGKDVQSTIRSLSSVKGAMTKKLGVGEAYDSASLDKYLANAERVIAKNKTISDSFVKLGKVREQAIKKAEQLEKLAAQKESTGVFSKSKIEAVRLDAQNLRQYASEMDNLQKGFKATRANVKELPSQIAKYENKLKDSSSALHEHTTLLQKMDRGAWFVEITKRAATYATVFGGLYAVTNSFRQAAAYVTEFDKAAATLNAVLDLNKDTARGLESQIVKLGIAYGGALDQINVATLELARAGVASKDVAAATEVVMKLALLTGDSVQTSAGSIVSFFEVFGNATNEAGDSVEELGGKLAYIANSSKLATQDIATFSNYALTAGKAAGATVDTIGALASTFSRLGINASTIGTQMRTLFLGITEESADTQSVFDGLGMSFQQFREDLLAGGPRGEETLLGLAETLKSMSDTDFNRLISSVDKLYGQALTNLRAGADMYRESLDEIKKSSGELDKADKAVEAYARTWERVKNAMGEFATDVLVPVADLLQSGTLTVLENKEEIADLTKAVGAMAGVYAVAQTSLFVYDKLLKTTAASTVLASGATRGYAASVGIATIATRGFNAALTMLSANPFLIAFTVAAGAMVYFTQTTDNAGKAAEEAADKMRKLNEEAAKAKGGPSTEEAQISKLEKGIASYEKLIKDLESKFDAGTNTGAAKTIEMFTNNITKLKEELELLKSGAKLGDGGLLQTFDKEDEQRIQQMISNLKNLYDVNLLNAARFEQARGQISGTIEAEIDQILALINSQQVKNLGGKLVSNITEGMRKGDIAGLTSLSDNLMSVITDPESTNAAKTEAQRFYDILQKIVALRINEKSVIDLITRADPTNAFANSMEEISRQYQALTSTPINETALQAAERELVAKQNTYNLLVKQVNEAKDMKTANELLAKAEQQSLDIEKQKLEVLKQQRSIKAQYEETITPQFMKTAQRISEQSAATDKSGMEIITSQAGTQFIDNMAKTLESTLYAGVRSALDEGVNLDNMKNILESGFKDATAQLITAVIANTIATQLNTAAQGLSSPQGAIIGTAVVAGAAIIDNIGRTFGGWGSSTKTKTKATGRFMAQANITAGNLEGLDQEIKKVTKTTGAFGGTSSRTRRYLQDLNSTQEYIIKSQLNEYNLLLASMGNFNEIVIEAGEVLRGLGEIGTRDFISQALFSGVSAENMVYSSSTAVSGRPRAEILAEIAGLDEWAMSTFGLTAQQLIDAGYASIERVFRDSDLEGDIVTNASLSMQDAYTLLLEDSIIASLQAAGQSASPEDVSSAVQDYVGRIISLTQKVTIDTFTRSGDLQGAMDAATTFNENIVSGLIANLSTSGIDATGVTLENFSEVMEQVATSTNSEALPAAEALYDALLEGENIQTKYAQAIEDSNDRIKNLTESLLGMRDQLMGTDLLGSFKRSGALQELSDAGLFGSTRVKTGITTSYEKNRRGHLEKVIIAAYTTVNNTFGSLEDAFGSREGLASFIEKNQEAILAMSEEEAKPIIDALQIATDYFTQEVVAAAQMYSEAINTAQSFIDKQQGLIDKIRGSEGTPEANINYLADRYQQELSRMQLAQSTYLSTIGNADISDSLKALAAADYQAAQDRYLELAGQYSDAVLETYKSSATGQALLDSIVADQESNIQTLSIERDIWLSQLQQQEDQTAIQTELLSEIRLLNATNAAIAGKDWTLVYDPAEATAADAAYLNSLS